MTDAPAALARFNALPPPQARAALLAICGSTRWADQMTALRPIPSAAHMHAESDRLWFALDPADWLEAFDHHPRIGERKLTAPKFAATAEQSTREQSGMNAATDAQRSAFAEGNAEYEKKFGHIFLICATGKSAAEMLDQLRTRLSNDATTELRNAAREQSLITRLRLERMLTA